MEERQKTRWGLVVLSLLAGIIAAMQVGKAPPAIPALRAELALGLVAAGWVVSLFNALGAACGFAAGWLVDGLGARRLVLLGLALLVAGSLLGAISEGAPLLLTARLIEGAGFLATVVGAPTIIARAAAAQDHRRALALWSTYLPAGMGTMMILAAALLPALGWRGLWLANAALVALFGLVFLLAARDLPAATRRQSSKPPAGAARPPIGPWLLAASFACYTVQFYGLMAWLPSFLIEGFGFGLAWASLATGLVVIANVPGNLLGGQLLQRGVARARLLAAASLALGLLGVAIYGLALGAGVKLVLAVLFSLIGGIIPAAVLAGAPVHSPSPARLGFTNGLIVQGSNLGTVIGPPLAAALVAALGGWQAPGWGILAAGCAGLASALVLGRVERRLALTAA